MNNYLISFQDEARALDVLQAFGYSQAVEDLEAEPGAEPTMVWNQGNSMVGGTHVILSYKAQTMPGPDGEDIEVQVPTLAPGFWVSLLAPQAHDEMWDDLSPNQPMIEFGLPVEPPDPVVPSAYVVRSANLTFDIDEIMGISPVWAGAPDMGFPYQAVSGTVPPSRAPSQGPRSHASSRQGLRVR